jgi:hypothetical protein
MNCAEVRHVILTADPSALRDRAEPALREHLAGCAACARAAALVVADTDRLRAALISRGSRPAVAPRRSRSRAIVTVIPIALAAELALFAVLSNRDTINPLLDRRVIDDTVTSLLPAARTGTDTGEVAPPPAPAFVPARVAPQVAATTPAPARETRLAAHDSATDADSLVAAASPAVEAAAAPLGVQSSRRQHTAVIATSNPKVTVVWITKGDSL